MSRVSMFLSSLAVLVIAVGLSGCGDASDSTPADQPEATSSDEHAGHDHGEGEHAGAMPASTEVTAAIAELPAEDRAAAEKQQICPVTDAALGSMGKPFKISVKDQDVFLCCEMCKDAVAEDPDKYLAKLNK